MLLGNGQLIHVDPRSWELVGLAVLGGWCYYLGFLYIWGFMGSMEFWFFISFIFVFLYTHILEYSVRSPGVRLGLQPQPLVDLHMYGYW